MGKIKNIFMCEKIKNRNYFYDNLKFILIVFFVFAQLLEPLVNDNKLANNLWYYIQLFNIPLIIYISGFYCRNIIVKRSYYKIFNMFLLYLIFIILIFISKTLIYGESSLDIFNVSSIAWYLLAIPILCLIAILTEKIKFTYIFIISILLSLIIGFDQNINDFLSFSRIITFFPFFLMGLYVDKNKIIKLFNYKISKVISVSTILISLVLIFYYSNIFNYTMPLLLGNSSYYELSNFLLYLGPFLKLGIYILSSIICYSILVLIPDKEYVFSIIGTRILGIYIFHYLFLICVQLKNFNLFISEYIIISGIVVLLFSLPIFTNVCRAVLNLKITKEK